MNVYDLLQDDQFTIIAGPCVLESDEINKQIVEKLISLSKEIGFNYIFKGSFDKANRSSITANRGPGIDKGLAILQNVKDTYGLYVTTDIHESAQAEQIGKVVDIVQVPAFLSRQTDLLIASANTGKVVNVKKAQFMSGKDMVNVVNKLEEAGCKNIVQTERGTMFGYNNLVVDLRASYDLLSSGYPFVFDATHSVQRPGGQGASSGGDREYVPHMMKAMAAMGVSNFFVECHPNPAEALSDSATSLALDDLEKVIRDTKRIWEANLSK